MGFFEQLKHFGAPTYIEPERQRGEATIRPAKSRLREAIGTAAAKLTSREPPQFTFLDLFHPFPGASGAPRAALKSFFTLTDPLTKLAKPREVTGQVLKEYVEQLKGFARKHTSGPLIERYMSPPFFHGSGSEAVVRNIKLGGKFGDVPVSPHSFGEPSGTSFSALPTMSEGFAFGEPSGVIRALPLFNPAQVLYPFLSSVDRKLMNQAYLTALKRLPEKERQRLSLGLSAQLKAQGEFAVRSNFIERTEASIPGITAFNKLLRESLIGSGAKGILHSPFRLGEHELRVLDPARTMLPIDIFQGGSQFRRRPSVERAKPIFHRLTGLREPAIAQFHTPDWFQYRTAKGSYSEIPMEQILEALGGR